MRKYTNDEGTNIYADEKDKKLQKYEVVKFGEIKEERGMEKRTVKEDMRERR